MVLAGIDAGGWFLLGSLGLGWPFAWACWWGWGKALGNAKDALDGWKNALDGWKNSTAGWRDANNRNEELIGKLRDVLATIRDLDGAHYPTTYGDGRPELCATCGAADGSWPCVSRQVADDLRRAIGDE